MAKRSYTQYLTLSLLIILLTNVIVYPSNTNAATVEVEYTNNLNATLRLRLDSINNVNESIPADSILLFVINDTTDRFYINGTVIESNIINLTSNNNFSTTYTDTFTIIDYKYLFNWGDIEGLNGIKADELPDNIKEFIDDELERVEELDYNFTNSKAFELFKEQWREAKLDINDVRMRIYKEQVKEYTENSTNINTVAIEVNRFYDYEGDEAFDDAILKIYDQTSTSAESEYILKLLKVEDDIYYGEIKNIPSSNRSAIHGPLILEYNISIDTSKLDIGNYTLYGEIDTGLGVKFRSEVIEFSADNSGGTNDENGDEGDDNNTNDGGNNEDNGGGSNEDNTGGEDGTGEGENDAGEDTGNDENTGDESEEDNGGGSNENDDDSSGDNSGGSDESEDDSDEGDATNENTSINSFLLDFGINNNLYYASNLNATLRLRLDSINNINASIPADSILSLVINDTINRFYINGTVIDSNLINRINRTGDTFEIKDTDNFTIFDYKHLFNWNNIKELNGKDANKLPDKVKEFIDKELEKAESIFQSEPSFRAFKDQWRNATIDTLANIRITTENIKDGNNIMPNNIVIEFRQFPDGKSEFAIYNKQRVDMEYIIKLLKRGDDIYYGDIKNIQSSNKSAIYGPLILEYNISIDTSKLDIGNYTLYGEIDTGLGVKFRSESVNTTIKVPSMLNGFEYIKRLEKGTHNIEYKGLGLRTNITKDTLIGIREVTRLTIDLSEYNLLSQIFEVRFHNKGYVDGLRVSIPYIVTAENAQLIGYNNGWIDAMNVARNENTLSGYFDDEGLFFVASKKVNESNEDESNNNVDREESKSRRSSSGGSYTIKPVMDNTFPIIVRADNASDKFSIDITKYGIPLRSLEVSLTTPTQLLYLTLTIPDNPPFHIDNMLSYFKLDTTMKSINGVKMIFDASSDIKLHKIISDRLVEVELSREGDKYIALTDSLGTFVVTIVKESNIIESTAIFPSKIIEEGNKIDERVEERIDIKRYDYLFDMYGYDIKIDFKGIINMLDIKEDENSLLLKVQGGGKMVITLPREVMDAKQADEEDAKFIILVDGRVANYQETRSDDKRVITIDIPDNSSEVQIIGSRVVPEFDVIVIILALSITIAILSKRSLKLYH